MKETVEEQQDFVKDITKMSDDFDRWYTDVVRKAEMADWSGVRGMMVVRPYGWAMWEAIQRAFDDMIKESGHETGAFPLPIPRELLVKEAEHIEGFGPEVAWVTKAGAAMEELEEPLAVRTTSETIIGHIIRRYIQSHRDLPKLTNQWNSVVRWEMRSRLFLRSREFWWQEGHTFHASAKEAIEEADLILGYYRSIAEDWLAVPVLVGKKSPAETFPGAVHTLTLEGLMRDGLALQMGTSHYFGQNFARAYDISFSNKDNERELCHSTSWGISTRMVGAIVMAHGADSGLIVPPRAAPVAGIATALRSELETFQKRLFERAQEFQRANTVELGTLDEVVSHFKEHGGFAWVQWCGDEAEEAKVKTDAGGVTIRTIDANTKVSGRCFVCGRPAQHRVALAKAY